MITDDERREVASGLRRQVKILGSRMDACEFAHYGADVIDPDCELWWDKMMLHLADLIDRPTCRLELTAVETYGNIKVKIYECSECGGSCEEIYGKYAHCPHCGAEVIDND